MPHDLPWVRRGQSVGKGDYAWRLVRQKRRGVPATTEDGALLFPRAVGSECATAPIISSPGRYRVIRIRQLREQVHRLACRAGARADLNSPTILESLRARRELSADCHSHQVATKPAGAILTDGVWESTTARALMNNPRPANAHLVRQLTGQ